MTEEVFPLSSKLIDVHRFQLCSLHECGLLVLWTVLHKTSTGVDTSLQNRKRIDHQSAWSSIKLTQTKVLDLRPIFGQSLIMPNMRPNSSEFNKTRSYFENELYSDVALQQLQEMDTDQTKLLTNFRCTALQVTDSGILIATNENCFLHTRKTLKANTVRFIHIDENKSARIESTLALSSVDGDIVLVALNDGKIKVLCCNQHTDTADDLPSNGDLDDGSVSSTSSLSPHLSVSHQANVDPSTASTSTDPNLLVNKSCTIQSLVQNERKVYDDLHATARFDGSEYKTRPGSARDNCKPAENAAGRFGNLLNGQMVSNGPLGVFKVATEFPAIAMLSRNQFVALHKNRLRVFGVLENELIGLTKSIEQTKAIVSAASTQIDRNKGYLVSLWIFIVVVCNLNFYVYYHYILHFNRFYKTHTELLRFIKRQLLDFI